MKVVTVSRTVTTPTPCLAILGVVCLALGCARAAGTSESAEATPVPPVEQVTSANAYNQRKDHFVDAVLAVESADWTWPGLDATKAIGLLERAQRTGDMSRVDEANGLIHAEMDRIDPTTSQGAVYHGAPLALMTAYLRYEDRPDLLHPETKERLKTGHKADGNVDPDHSLVVYRDLIFSPYTADNVNLGIAEFNPWQPQPTPDYNGTENHKLQLLTVALLMTEIYAGESYDGFPVKDDTAETDDFWHYFRDAFLRYSSKWEAGYPTDHFGGDVNGVEKDASQYTRVYVQDYWLIRDLFSDPVVSKHAEILLDRTLIDMAEDTVMGMYTGAAGRYYESLPTEGINQHVHIIDYFLFDSLGYELPLDHEYVWGFGAWGYANMIASDYNPTSPDFPKAIVDLAIDKEDGYLSRDRHRTSRELAGEGLRPRVPRRRSCLRRRPVRRVQRVRQAGTRRWVERLDVLRGHSIPEGSARTRRSMASSTAGSPSFGTSMKLASSSSCGSRTVSRPSSHVDVGLHQATVVSGRDVYLAVRSSTGTVELGPQHHRSAAGRHRPDGQLERRSAHLGGLDVGSTPVVRGVSDRHPGQRLGGHRHEHHLRLEHAGGGAVV